MNVTAFLKPGNRPERTTGPRHARLQRRIQKAFDEVTRSLYEELGTAGPLPVHAVRKTWAANRDETEERLLPVAPGAAGLSIQRISDLASGRVAGVARSPHRGDACGLVAELRPSDAEDTK